MSNDTVVSLATPAGVCDPPHGASAVRGAAADRGRGGVSAEFEAHYYQLHESAMAA